MRSHVLRLCVVVFVALALVVGATQLYAGKPPVNKCPTGKPGCFCADYYAPVVCDGNCRYSNICYANCAGAKNCIGIGPGPVEY